MNQQIVISGPYYSNFVRCVEMCCIEKGLNYELKCMSGQDLIDLNPFAKVPVFQSGELVIYETEAICRYIDRNYGEPLLSPQDAEQAAWMDQWISAAICYFDSAIIRRYLLEYAFPKGEGSTVRQDIVAEAEKDIIRYLDIMSNALSRKPYFSGESVGIADFLIVPMLDYLANGMVPTQLLQRYPVVLAYYTKMLGRESCQKILGNPQATTAA